MAVTGAAPGVEDRVEVIGDETEDGIVSFGVDVGLGASGAPGRSVGSRSPRERLRRRCG